MKILLINNFHYRKGGADAVYFNTADLLRRHGHEVIFYSQTWPENEACPQQIFFPKGISYTGSINIADKVKGVINFFYNKEAAERLQQLIDQEHPDIAHTHLIWGALAPSILQTLRRNHIPIVSSIHDYRLVCPAYTFTNGANRICELCGSGSYYHCFTQRCANNSYIRSGIMTMEMYFRSQFFAPTRLVDHFIYVSKFCRSIHERHNHQLANKPSSVVYNFSNEDVLLEHQTKQNCFNSYYLYYGRLSREKGLSTLLQAFFACPSIQLRIIGDGPLKAELEELCQLHGAPNIRFLGYKKGQELYNIVASAKYVIVPSEWYENNPMTIIESYTLSTPVIASCIGGITEIVKDHTTGFLVQPSSISDLIRVIREADSSSENDYLKMQKAAQDFANAHFDRETYYQQLMSIYSTLVS